MLSGCLVNRALKHLPLAADFRTSFRAVPELVGIEFVSRRETQAVEFDDYYFSVFESKIEPYTVFGWLTNYEFQFEQ